MSDDNYKYILRIHGESFTVDHPHPTEFDAEAHAWELMSHGVRVGNRIYPSKNVVYYEIIEKEKD